MKGSVTLVNHVIAGRTLPGYPAGRQNQVAHVGNGELLPVGGPGRAADTFIHQGAAQVIHARVQAGLHPVHSQLHPGSLYVRDLRMQDQPGDGVHQQGFPERGALARPALAIDGRFHVDKGKRDKFGKTARLFLQVADMRSK